MTLTDYRQRYGLYKGDPDLQAAHASCCFLPSFDDHEVANNWAGEAPPETHRPKHSCSAGLPPFRPGTSTSPFARAWCRAAPTCAPTGLQLRQGSPTSPCSTPGNTDRSRRAAAPASGRSARRPRLPSRTMLGEAQERWLAERLARTRERGRCWRSKCCSRPMNWRSFPWVRTAEPARNMDAWDGTTAARDRVLGMIRNGGHKNPVVLTGDAHMGLAFEHQGGSPATQLADRRCRVPRDLYLLRRRRQRAARARRGFAPGQPQPEVRRQRARLYAPHRDAVSAGRRTT